MNSTPLLQSLNRFAPLFVDESLQSKSSAFSELENDSPAVHHNPKPLRPHPKRIPKWERRLPERYVLAATPSASSFDLKVEIQTTDTGDVHAIPALLDSGATGLFIDPDFVRSKHLTTRPLSRAIPVYNVDGSPNEAGAIREVVDVVLRYRDHTERTQFAVTGLGKSQMILGLSWLREHNPEINWATSEVKMSRCPKRCRTCENEVAQERKVRKVEAAKIRACRAGPLPDPEVDSSIH